jgi:hypothetical protein
VKLKPWLYYFCARKKRSFNIIKARKYCSVVHCPFLKAKPRKSMEVKWIKKVYREIFEIL